MSMWMCLRPSRRVHSLAVLVGGGRKGGASVGMGTGRRSVLAPTSSVLVASQAVAVALQVGRHGRVGLLAVRVDAAAHPPRLAEAVLRKVLHDALAAAAAVVEEDRLHVAPDRRL